MAEGLSTTAVINYRANVDDVKRKVIEMQRLNTAMAKNLGRDFTKGVKVVKQELTKISQSVKPIKLVSGKETRKINTFTTVVRAANGQLTTITQKTAGAGKNFKVLNTTVKAGAAGMRTFGQNLATLAKRAALTIPLWFVLRQGIGSVFRTIREGLSSIVDFDKALQKAKRNLQGTTDNIAKNFATLKSEVTKLSIETGKSVEDITNAFQKFATVGFDFETSLAGAQNATKLSILLFGDATETANAFARSMRVLIDTTQGAKPASEQLADVMALTAELWKTNAFELNEMTGALERFAPVAKTAGFSAEESVKIIATLGTAALRGTRGGRLLATSIARLVTKTDELAKSLGVKVNPEMDRTFDVFLRTLDVLAKTRREAGKISPEFEKITKSIFGLRSSQAIKGLIALNKELKSNLAIVGDVSKFNKEFKEVNDEVFQLSAQFKNLNREMGKAFVNGIIGADNFKGSLQEIIKAQTVLNNKIGKFGENFRNTFISAGVAGISLLSLKYGGLLALLATPVAPVAITGLVTFGLLSMVGFAEDLEKTAKDSHETFLEIGADIGKKINEGYAGSLSLEGLELLIARMESIGSFSLKMDDASFESALVALKKIRDKEKEISKIKKDQKDASGKTTILEAKRQKIAKIVLAHELSILRARGANTAELLKAESLIRNQLNIEKKATDQYKDRLALQRAINDEKELEGTLSSRTKKLAEIGRTEGVESARAIGEVLSGGMDFSTFEKIGGKDLEIFKKEFANIFQEQQDIKFLAGKGFGIPVARQDEFGIRGNTGRIRVSASLAQGKAQLQIKALEKAANKTELNTGANIANTSAIDKLRLVFEKGGTVTGAQALAAKRIDSTIKIDLNINGNNLKFQGTPEEIKASASRMAPTIIPILERAIAHTLRTNNNADISKAVDERTNKF